MATPHRRAVILSALPIERTGVLEHLRDVREEPHPRGSVYRRATFDDRSEPWDVLLAEVGVGNESAAAEAERAIAHFSPQVAIFVGVAGAIKDLSHGDVVASTKIYNYESGKDGTSGFETRPETELPAYSLRERARYEAGETDWRQRIRSTVEAVAGSAEPSARVGPIAAGPKVLASTRSVTYKFIRKKYGDALAVEMEGHGFLLGVRMNHPVQGIVVRGISDRIGDKTPDSDRDWQPVAARHAAAFVFQILAKLPPAQGETTPSLSADVNPQQVRFGDITGDNNTFNFNQHQGPMTQIIGVTSPDGNTEIDLASERTQHGEPDVAIHLLSTLRKRRWDVLTPRERFRLLANLGHALERKGDLPEAALHYIEAKGYQPQDEKARSLEAVAYVLLGDYPRAYDLATSVLVDHPTSSLATAVRVKCAPDTTPFSELEQSIPAPLRENFEVVHVLGWRAAQSGDVSTAERLTRVGLRLCPDSMEFQELLGSVLVQAEARAWRDGQQTPSSSRLDEAVAALSSALVKAKGAKNIARIRHMRAEAHFLLNQTEEAETDFRSAWEFDKDDAEISFRFALFLERRGRRDAAIDVLQRAVKAGFVPQNCVLVANLLGERNRPGDRAAAASILQQAIPHTASAESDTRAGLVATLAYLHSAMNQHDEAIRVLDSLPTGYVTEVVGSVLRADVLRRAGRKEEALGFARQTLQAIGVGASEQEQLRVAEALNALGEHRHALSIWKKVLKPTRLEPIAGMALECAKKVGDDGFIFSFCQGLRSNGVNEPYCLELEVLTLERYGCFDEAIALMQHYLEAPAKDDLARVFRVHLSLIGLRLGRHDLLVTDITKLPLVDSAPVRVGGFVAYILRQGPSPEEGVKYAYELVRHHFLEPEARQIYVGIVGMGDELAESFPDSTTIVAGCAVKYQVNDSGEEKWVIIEDGTDPRMDREEIPPDHLWAKEMCGKAVGEVFYLRRDELQDRTATILAICSKYVYRKFEILSSWEERFPEVFFVRKYTFSDKKNGSSDFGPIFRALDRREQQTEQLNTLYRENPISVTTFALLSKTGLLESLQHLAFEGSLSVRCCMGNNEEYQKAEASLQAAQILVLDPSALATLFFSGRYEDLALVPQKILVCDSTLQEYRELQRKLRSATAGFMGKRNGRYVYNEIDAADREQQLQKVGAFLARIPSLVSVESGQKLADLNVDNRQELISLFGQPTAESIAAAGQEGACLWTDDLAVAEVARAKLGTRRVWTQLVMRWITSTGKMPSSDFADLTLFLLQWNYFFTRVEPDAVLAACKRASWDPKSPPLNAVIKWFGAPELEDPGAVAVCAMSLALVWKHAVLVHRQENLTRALMQVLLSRKNGRFLVTAVRHSIDQIFGLDVMNARLCKSIIDGTFIGETPSGLILPNGNKVWS